MVQVKDKILTKVPPFMGFSRQEYWSGVPLPSPISPLSVCLNPENINSPPLPPCKCGISSIKSEEITQSGASYSLHLSSYMLSISPILVNLCNMLSLFSQIPAYVHDSY